MHPEPTAVATLGDLQELKVELKDDLASLKVELKDDLASLKVELKDDLKAVREELVALEVRLEERMIRSLSAEIGRVANVIMEHTTAEIRGAGDHTRAVEDRLDIHIADVAVHRRPARARRS